MPNEINPIDVLSEVGPEVLRGNAALWLGQGWQMPDAAASTSLARVSWLAVWSETTDSALASLLKREWPADALLRRRVPVEVPDRLSDTLGSYFALSEICPIFYLAGREDSWRGLLPRQQRRARDEQVDVIARLQGSVLVMAGFSTADQVVALIRDELPPAAVRFVVVGLPATERDKLLTLGPTSPAFLGGYPGQLPDLLRDIEQAFRQSAPRPRAIKVGQTDIDIGPLFEREHPIDQDFTVLTTETLRAPDASEDRDVILDDFVAGRMPPWRAFAHNLHWRRSKDFWSNCLQMARDTRRLDGASVACLNMPGEAGSGLTTLMHELAFRLSQDGLPVLVIKPGVTRLDYDLLRVFLEYISQNQSHSVPAVLVYDDSEPGFDDRKGTAELLLRLARDGRHVVMLRSVSIRRGADFDNSFRQDKAVFGRANEKVLERWIPEPLRAALTAVEQTSLIEWAVSRWSVQNTVLAEAVKTWGADWPMDDEPPPLLVCLYSLLRDHVTSATGFGKHLFARLKHLFSEGAARDGDGSPTLEGSRHPLSSDELASAVAQLQEHFRKGQGRPFEGFGTTSAALSAQESATLCVALAVLGCLRVPVSRAVLEQVAGLTSSQIHRGLVVLEGTDLVRLSLGAADTGNLRLARRAFYTDVELVGFRHPVMARLLLDWLLVAASPDDVAMMSCSLLSEVIADYGNTRLPAYPIRLLKPVFRGLRPSQGIVAFVDDVCTRFLRLQRVRGSDYHRWQWTDQSVLLEVLDSLPESVARQSASVLHTRGITRYKSCSSSLPLSECRRRYEAAEADLRLAADRARDSSDGEKPVHIITSHGLMYQRWARQELERGSSTRAVELRELARQYLRDGLRLGGERENSYAAFGLASLLIEECERGSDSSDQEFAGRLGEAIDLLQLEPEESFEVEWLELKQRALQLLDGDAAGAVIARLRASGDELGLALDALRIVGGEIPLDGFAGGGIELQQAWKLLVESAATVTKKSPLAALLRYAIYSVMPERAADPQFDQRYALIRHLEGTRYLERPIWLFDYAMLSLQTGQIRTGSDAFRRLRGGGRFLEVPLERARYLSQPDRPAEARVARFRVVRLDEDDKGWARVTDPTGFTEPVPFAAKVFRSAGSPTSVGATMVGRLRIRPSGPSAEPLRAADSRSS